MKPALVERNNAIRIRFRELKQEAVRSGRQWTVTDLHEQLVREFSPRGVTSVETVRRILNDKQYETRYRLTGITKPELRQAIDRAFARWEQKQPRDKR